MLPDKRTEYADICGAGKLVEDDEGAESFPDNNEPDDSDEDNVVDGE